MTTTSGCPNCRAEFPSEKYVALRQDPFQILAATETHTWMCRCTEWPAHNSRDHLSTPRGETDLFHRCAPRTVRSEEAQREKQATTIDHRMVSLLSWLLHCGHTTSSSAEDKPWPNQWAIRRTTTRTKRRQGDRQELPDSRPHAELGHQSDRQELPGGRPEVDDDIRATASNH